MYLSLSQEKKAGMERYYSKAANKRPVDKTLVYRKQNLFSLFLLLERPSYF